MRNYRVSFFGYSLIPLLFYAQNHLSLFLPYRYPVFSHSFLHSSSLFICSSSVIISRSSVTSLFGSFILLPVSNTNKYLTPFSSIILPFQSPLSTWKLVPIGKVITLFFIRSEERRVGKECRYCCA